MKIELEVQPFRFPNFLNTQGIEDKFSVGLLTDEQAAEYWDSLKERWVAHCRSKRADSDVPAFLRQQVKP